MVASRVRLGVVCLVSLLAVGAGGWSALDAGRSAAVSASDGEQREKKAMKVQYLEIVTPAVSETCEALSKAHGVVFGDPIPGLGNARTADLKEGGRIGVRAPMRETEDPVVRPYVLVDDIKAAVAAAEKAGGKVAIPPMEIPGQGTFAIYVLGGIDHGLWEM